MKVLFNLRVIYRAAFFLALLLSLAAFASAQTVKLNHDWQFLADKTGALSLASLDHESAWRAAQVGVSWNAQFADLRDYMGIGWYRTRFEVPRFSESRHILIRFGAVDYYTEVFVNGRKVGSHEGGYTPFFFDVTYAAKTGMNELVVRVIDPPMDEQENRARFPRMLYNEIPHGKQNWYVQTSGIWQAVWLEFRPGLYIEQVHITPHIDGNFAVEVRATGTLPQGTGPNIELGIDLHDPSGQSVFTKTEKAGPAWQEHTLNGRIKSPRLWSPDSPALYTMEITLKGGGTEDHATEQFGFRSFEARDGKFYLNGKPFYMLAALDQAFYPDTIYTPPSEEYVRDEMLKGKRLGLNLLRCHIKVPDPVYLKVADEVGMLVWYEIPSWNDEHQYTPKAAARGERTLAEMVARDWNHPSIVIQSIINESWGADLKQEEQRRWLRAAYERAKTLTAPLGRLIDDNSACCDNFHVETDIDDFHQYYSMPDEHARWDSWTAEFAARPRWTFSPFGDAVSTGREPLVVSEFGNWGLPRLPKQLPWWFDRDFAGREVTRPAGLLDRFKQFQFARLFTDFNNLAEETERHQFISLKHEIEEIRRYASIQGYVITEFTDINWEVNGLMDMWRKPKVYADELAWIQQPDVVLARLPKNNYTSGERVQVETALSHYSDKELSGATLRWTLEFGANGSFNVNEPVGRAGVTALQPVSFTVPEVERPRRERLLIEVRGRDNSLIAKNEYDLFIFPKAAPPTEVPIVFYDPAHGNGTLAQALASAGLKVSTDMSGAGSGALLIATKYDEQVERYLHDGGRAILLLNSADGLPASAPFKVKARAGSDLDGNWVTNFNWIRSDTAPFGEVAFSRVLGFESDSVVPRYIIQGVPAEAYSDVMSGIFYGWLNDNGALAVQMRVGEGRVFATTFRFDRYGSDPYATHLLDAIIRYAGSTGFTPKLKMG